MDIKYICEFVHLAETCSFQETAAEMYVSQSSLTKHIQAIEQELGVQLFNRSTRKVVLNRYGKAFYSYARQIAELSDEYSKAIKRMAVQSDFLLTIGALGNMSFYGLYGMLSDFKSEYPDINYSVIEARDDELKAKLEASEISFVFTSSIHLYREFEYCVWKKDPLVLICAQNHPLAKNKTVSVEQLKDLEIIVHGPPADIDSRIFNKACKEAGFTPTINAQVSFSSTIVQLVKSHHGVSVIGKGMLSDRDLSGITVIPITPTMEVSIYLVHNTYALNQTETNFFNFVMESVSKNEISI